MARRLLEVEVLSVWREDLGLFSVQSQIFLPNTTHLSLHASGPVFTLLHKISYSWITQ